MLAACPHCTSPIPSGKHTCPHCGQARGPIRSTAHAATMGAVLLGLVACAGGEDKTDTENYQPEYGVSETQTDTDSEQPTETESDQEEYGVPDTGE